ncbi:MAG: DJ-1/PfpI family protein [Planctomycetota bacterium]|jgi:protease I
MKRLLILGFSAVRRAAGKTNLLRTFCRPTKYCALLVALLLVGLAALCSGQYRSRVALRRILQLPEPKLTGSLSFEEALAKRRSVRQFASLPLALDQLAQLAWAGQGITERQQGFRTAPSAGAIYPITMYFATPEGLFLYNPGEHSLEQTSNEDLRTPLALAALQQAVAEAPCDIILAGSVRKLTAQYGKKARRYMLLEAGHIAQNIHLQAVALQLGSVPISAFEIREVSRTCRLPKELEPIYIISVGYPAQDTDETAARRRKRAVMIVASRDFRDEELFETRIVLDRAGVETVIASSRRGPVRGMLGGIAEATILVDGLRVDDFDAIIFIGGPGAREYFGNPAARDIARQAADKRKILAAICIAPTILANAGVLSGVRATGFLSERDTLQRAGVKYTGAPVERDGSIITARDPTSASQFGTAIADALALR